MIGLVGAFGDVAFGQGPFGGVLAAQAAKGVCATTTILPAESAMELRSAQASTVLSDARAALEIYDADAATILRSARAIVTIKGGCDDCD